MKVIRVNNDKKNIKQIYGFNNKLIVCICYLKFFFFYFKLYN